MDRLAGKIDAVFADMDVPQHPGAALLVIDHDEITYSKCYGLADLETQRPITTDTSFYLGSISKQFTTMAIMLLAEDGRLNYEDCLPAYFPQLPLWSAEISIRHLLHHTAGLPGYMEFFSSNARIPEWTRDVTGVTNEAVLERTIGLAGLEFPVGTQYAYSGVGYTLLAMIVAIVSGQSFAEFLQAKVFDPLGMKHTVVYDASRPTHHKLAHGYWKDEGQFQRWDYPLLTAGDGGLFSTLDDLFLWDQALNTECLVPKAVLEQAFTSGATNDGAPVGYGFGWITNVLPYCNASEREQLLALGGTDLRHVAHGGSCVAYNNYIIRLLDTQRTIIVLTNHMGVPGPRIRAHKVVEILFGY
ncbi:beta-lactamase family protein [Agrobacterium rhizogenes]|uniref:serine hydrolase domain-containing protein n=1 Tax=Rhizobium rhizogenes TaxID=359 RepID=UPI0015744AF7|nr:serine hydrolase domain-containing protein [Rhizobium rhizogenes]NTF86376.1 beta-lactamase family protein [Rhizobium rhizogenes]